MMSADTRPVPPGTSFYMSMVGAPAFNAGKVKSISGIKVVDPYTLEIDLSKPDATILYALTMSFCDVVPKEWVAKWGTKFIRHPLGTGPYMMDHWTSGTELVLKRNPNFWDWRNHPDAWVDGIKISFSINPQTALLKLKRGENDILGDYIAPADYVSVTHDPVWSKQVANAPAIAIDYLFMNVRMKPFDNPKVRQAVAWAINRDKLIKLISGAGSRLDQIYPAGLPGHVEGTAGVFYGYDPAKAKQLLTDAGYPTASRRPCTHTTSTRGPR
jgi:ABC-type transport system substrate-binding protein